MAPKAIGFLVIISVNLVFSEAYQKKHKAPLVLVLDGNSLSKSKGSNLNKGYVTSSAEDGAEGKSYLNTLVQLLQPQTQQSYYQPDKYDRYHRFEERYDHNRHVNRQKYQNRHIHHHKDDANKNKHRLPVNKHSILRGGNREEDQISLQDSYVRHHNQDRKDDFRYQDVDKQDRDDRDRYRNERYDRSRYSLDDREDRHRYQNRDQSRNRQIYLDSDRQDLEERLRDKLRYHKLSKYRHDSQGLEHERDDRQRYYEYRQNRDRQNRYHHQHNQHKQVRDYRPRYQDGNRYGGNKQHYRYNRDKYERDENKYNHPRVRYLDREERHRLRDKVAAKSPLLKSLLRAANELECEAKDECMYQCFVKYEGLQREDCEAMCDSQFECYEHKIPLLRQHDMCEEGKNNGDECDAEKTKEETKDNDECQLEFDECALSDEVAEDNKEISTKGELLVTEKNECKRCKK